MILEIDINMVIEKDNFAQVSELLDMVKQKCKEYGATTYRVRLQDQEPLPVYTPPQRFNRFQ